MSECSHSHPKQSKMHLVPISTPPKNSEQGERKEGGEIEDASTCIDKKERRAKISFVELSRNFQGTVSSICMLADCVWGIQVGSRGRQTLYFAHLPTP